MASIINASTTGVGGIPITGDASGILQLQANSVPVATLTAAGTGTLLAGAVNPVIALTGSANNYIQAYLVNSTNGVNSSADITCYPHNGTDASGFIDMGITSLGFAQAAYNVTIGNEGYIFMSAPSGSSTSGNLIIATDSTGTQNDVKIFTGGFSQGQTLPKLDIDGATGYMTGCVKGMAAGLYQSSKYYRLNSTVAGANATGAQSIFGVGVTLAASTQYEFEAVVYLLKSAGTTSHTISLLFGGTATLNNIAYFVEANASGTAQLTVDDTTITQGNVTVATAVVTTAAITTATTHFYYIMKGTVSVNGAGTFIPQYSLSAAPGGAYTTQIGSYFKISPIAASGANVNIGGWA